MRRPSAPILRGSGPSGSHQQPGWPSRRAGRHAEGRAGRDEGGLEGADERPDHQAAGGQGDDRVGDQLAGAVVGHLAAALDPDDLDAAAASVASSARMCAGSDVRPGSGPRDARAGAAGRRWRRRRARPRGASGARVRRGTGPVRAMSRRSAPAPGSTRAVAGASVSIATFAG